MPETQRAPAPQHDPVPRHDTGSQRTPSAQRDPATQWDIVSGVGYTALAVAAGRATESKRGDRLVDDPFAEPLVRAAHPETPLPGWGDGDQAGDNEAGAASAHWQKITSYLGVRAHFFDDFFKRAGKAGARQAVVLASGLDTRPYRLNWPSDFAVFEIDQPLVLEFKDTVLGDMGVEVFVEHRMIPMDLRDDWATALTEAGFDRRLPTAWLAEGLLPYLPADAEAQLLRVIHEFSAPGSRIALDNISKSPDSLVLPEMREMSDDVGVDVDELFSSEPRPSPESTLAESGWDVRRQPTAQVASELGRELSGTARSLSEQQYFLQCELPR